MTLRSTSLRSYVSPLAAAAAFSASVLVGCATVDDVEGTTSQEIEPIIVAVGGSPSVSRTSASALLCRSCTTNAQCGTGALCLRNSNTGARFCGAPCTTSCAAGYTCKSFRVSTGNVRQCSPVGGACGAPVADAGAPRTDAGATDAARADATPAPADTGTPSAPPATGGVPTVGGCAVFPANSPWNQDVSALPVHPNSAAIIANIQAHGETMMHADFGATPGYGIPYVVVPITQPRLPVTFNEYGDESDPGPYPAPVTAPMEAGGDRHVLVIQQGTCNLFEMYHAAHTSSAWTAGAGAVFNLGSNTLRPSGWTSCDQAGLPVFPGLTRYDEVTAGEIRHALRVTFNHTRDGWVTPATHPGGNSDVNAPPMGLRLRLRANYDISRFTGQSRVILNALRKYGMFVADTGSNWFVSGGSDSRWNDNDLYQLTGVPGTAFEAVYTGDVQHY